MTQHLTGAEKDRLRDLCRGRTEWQIRKSTGIAMWFDDRESIDPEKAARHWLASHRRDYPEQYAGYEVVEATEQTELQRGSLALLAELDSHRQALDLLCGLHPGITVDEPLAVALAIFGHVLAERAEHQRARENDMRNIEWRDALIRQYRAQPQEKK